MYKPTEIEKKVCRDVVKDILGNSNDLEYEKYIEEILSLTYSIGGDYSKTTISSVAKVVLKDVL